MSSKDIHSRFLHHCEQFRVVLQKNEHVSFKQQSLSKIKLKECTCTYTRPLHVPHILPLEVLDVFANHFLSRRIRHTSVKVEEGQHTCDVDDRHASVKWVKLTNNNKSSRLQSIIFRTERFVGNETNVEMELRASLCGRQLRTCLWLRLSCGKP